MNKLQLCNKLIRKAEVQGGDLATTISQTGESKRIVEFIDEAYMLIQKSKATWSFLRNDVSLALVSGTQEYSDATVARWLMLDPRVYLTATGVSDEQRISFVPWEDFKSVYLMAAARSATGRPSVVSIKPDNKLIFYPIPDDSYTFVAESYDTADSMTTDTSEPVFNEDYHLAIIYRALMIYAGEYTGEADKYDIGKIEYRKLYNKLAFDQLERLSFGEPLA